MGRVSENPEPPLDDEIPDTERSTAETTTGEQHDEKEYWVNRAREMFEASESWFDTNIRDQVERNIDNLANRHPSGSKYYTDAYRHRSKIFRPKIRTAQRGLEAALVTTMFANREMVVVSAEDENDIERAAGAQVVQEMVKSRLSDTRTHWFKTVCGATMDAWSQGVIISKQQWVMETMLVDEPNTYDSRGMPSKRPVVKQDRPDIELIPTEYFRFDPAADWRDPVNTSPYLVEVQSWHIVDVQARMIASQHDGSSSPWTWYDKGQLQSAGRPLANHSTSQTREGHRVDPRGDSVHRTVSDHDVIWIHVNTERDVFGVDWQWLTVGTELLLTEPRPIYELYPHLLPGERPYTMGVAVVEPHKVYPPSMSELSEGLQQATNEIQNSRFDNVRLAMNRRFRIRRGANVDLKALREQVPGGAYMVDDVEKDVAEETVHDVTGSAYEESTRLQLDLDDLTGAFSGGSVASNRSLNETVGGMNMLRGEANAAKEHQVRTILMTWMEPALDQFMRLIQWYETDETVMHVAGANAELFQRLESPLTDNMLTQRLAMKIRSSVGAFDPIMRSRHLMEAAQALMEFPGLALRINGDEVAKEIFGAIGLDDGQRFLHDSEDEQYAALVEQIQELQQQIESKQVEAQGRMQVAEVQGEARLRLEELKQAREDARRYAEFEFEAQVKNAENEHQRKELQLQRDALVWQMTLEEYDRRVQAMERRTMSYQPSEPGKGISAPESMSSVPGKVGTMARRQYGNIPNKVG